MASYNDARRTAYLDDGSRNLILRENKRYGMKRKTRMTWVEWTGCAGFLCYFLYDINSITWKNKLLQRFFLLGTLLVAFSSVGIIADGFDGMRKQPLCVVFFGIFALFFLD